MTPFSDQTLSRDLGDSTSLAEFELLFVDSQGLDAGLEGRWWNSKLSRCSGRSGNPASSLSERRLDNLPLASRLNIQSRRCFSPRCLRRSPLGKPQLINVKNIGGAQDDGPFNYVLQLTDIA